jgi:hypothetical protein
LKAPQKSLKDWGTQKWRTKSGKPSTQGPKATGERYLPESPLSHYLPPNMQLLQGKTIKLSKQFVKQPKSILERQRGLDNG